MGGRIVLDERGADAGFFHGHPLHAEPGAKRGVVAENGTNDVVARRDENTALGNFDQIDRLGAEMCIERVGIVEVTARERVVAHACIDSHRTGTCAYPSIRFECTRGSSSSATVTSRPTNRVSTASNMTLASIRARFAPRQ